MKIEVCILAGGRSARMGKPKGAMKLDGLALVDWSKRIAHGAGFAYRVVDRDLGESRGPVSGIETALKTTRAEAVIFLSCDMPFVRSETLRRLAAVAAGKGAAKEGEGPLTPALSPRRGRSNGCASVFSRVDGLVGFPFLISKGVELRGESLQELARGLGARMVSISEEEAFNLNTPGEFREAERRLKEANRQTILDVDALGIRRGEVEILRDVNWRVKRGEHWAILGANGSGKTSLLSALTGYMSPTRGRIRLLGREFGRADWRELRKHVGLVSSALRQLMAESETALETVASGKEAMIDVWGPLKGAERKRGREILAEIGCSYLEKRVWAVLSQGERQRVLIGRALMARPEALILDEPCAGLDPAAREHFLEFLQGLTEKRNGPAIILVTHHVEEIVPGLTHVLALKDGVVAAAGEMRGTLTSGLLGEIFSCGAKLRRRGGRYELKVSRGPKGII